MRSTRFVATLCAVVAIPLAIAGCSSATAPSAAGSATSAKKPAANTDPDAGLLTGTQLKAALAPATFFHAGLTLDPDGSSDTGATFQEPHTAPATKPDCTKLDGSSWIGITGIDGVSFAENDYIDKDTSAELTQEIDVYRGTTAQTVLTDLGKIAQTCPSFTDSQTSSKVTVTEQATSGLGNGAYTITLSDPNWQTGSTLIAARVGTAVVTVLSTDGGTNGNASAMHLATQLVTSLHGKA